MSRSKQKWGLHGKNGEEEEDEEETDTGGTGEVGTVRFMAPELPVPTEAVYVTFQDIVEEYASSMHNMQRSDFVCN